MTHNKNSEAHHIRVLEHRGEGDKVHALLHDIVGRLDKLLQNDEISHIDLGAIGLSAGDKALLSDVLGGDSMLAEIQEFGLTRVTATGIPGVWWVVHLDEREHVIDEFIEINYCPDILIATIEDIRDGREALKARLFAEEMARKRRTPGM